MKDEEGISLFFLIGSVAKRVEELERNMLQAADALEKITDALAVLLTTVRTLINQGGGTNE